MKYEIKSLMSGEAIFSLETQSLSLCVEAAVEARANLRGANLTRADLTDADLRGANLRGADLTGANLTGAYLTRADLTRAYLTGANLTRADLTRADLTDADLTGAYLTRADLTGAYLTGAYLTDADLARADLARADLRGADLTRAYLTGANLTGAYLRATKGINRHLVTPLRILLDQPGVIRAYKLTTADGWSPFQASLKIKYVIGNTYEAAEADTDEFLDCGPGINLATLDWCLRNWQAGYRILIAEFMAVDIAAIPIGSHDKFRVRHCQIVGEKNLAELDWPPKKPEEARA